MPCLIKNKVEEIIKRNAWLGECFVVVGFINVSANANNINKCSYLVPTIRPQRLFTLVGRRRSE